MAVPSFPTSYDPNHPQEAIVPLPNAPFVQIASDPFTLSYQAPLTHRGTGPGLVIFEAPAPPSGTEKANTLDPLPYFKWAEEGYGIAQVGNDVAKDQKSIGDAIGKALEVLEGAKEVDIKDKFAILVFDPALVEVVTDAVAQYSSKLCTLVSFGVAIPDRCSIMSLSHIFNSPSEPSDIDMEDALKCPEPDPNFNPYTVKKAKFTYVHADEKVTREQALMGLLPSWGEQVYDHGIANLAHTRTLSFLKPRINGPWFDLEKIWDAHTWYEFVGRSVAQTMGTMVAEPYVNHVPTMIGGVGREKLSAFYRDHFIFANPPDTSLEVVSRTVGIDRIVDEFIFKCNHSTEWSWFLPGVPPTHKDLRVPFIAVVCVRGDRLFHEHIWWDHASAIRQVGLMPTSVPYGDGQQLRLPIAGVEGAHKLQNENLPSNEMLEPEWGVTQAN